ncbi:MAG: hypothetical protein IJP47_06205 [Prevotella sp.]|nr:hypothetical protein [Prevotella sp.]
MKKLFTLFLMTCMMSFADTATAQSITGWTLNVQRNDETAVDITRSDFSNYDNIGNVTALLLNSMNITTTGTFDNVTLWVNMHKEGEDKNEWHDVSATPDGAGNWTFTGPIDLYELAGDDGNWLLKFYVEGISGGTSVKDDDNGAYYLFNFTIASGGSGGGSDWTVKYYAQSTATLDLTWNGTTNRNYVYNGDGIREQYYGENPGEVGSLVINGFTTRFIYNKDAGVGIQSVTLQYRINVDGAEGEWNGLNGTLDKEETIWNPEKERYEYRRIYSANNLNLDVVYVYGLEPGHNYELQLMYQIVTTAGDYIFMRQGANDMKLAFTVTEQSAAPTYKGMTVTLTEDGTEYADIDVSGGSLVSKVSTSLVLNNFKVTLGGENIEAVRLYWRVYPDEMGGGSSDIQWNSVDATVRNGEVWSGNCNIDLLGSGVNIEIPEGLQSNKAYRFYCYIAPLVSGTWLQSQEWGDLRIDIKTGNLTAVESVSETVVNKNAPKYSVAGARVGDGYKGIVIQGGKKIMQ